jgi:hypothetical protein
VSSRAFLDAVNYRKIFLFWVLHPAAHTLSRLLEEPSFAIVYSALRWPARADTCSGKININKHLEELLRGTVLLITLIGKYLALAGIEPQSTSS